MFSFSWPVDHLFCLRCLTNRKRRIGNPKERVEAQSAVFKKELGLRDLVLTQIVFVVGSSWVGTAAKLGSSQTVYWLLAILLFYLPVASVVIYLNRIMPLEGGLYQWAKFGFNDFTGFIVAWNLWLLGIVVMAGVGLVIATNLSYAIGPSAAWMPSIEFSSPHSMVRSSPRLSWSRFAG